MIDNKKVKITDAGGEERIRELLDSSYQGVMKLFVLAYDNKAGNNQVAVDSFKKYFLPGVKIGNYNIEIDGRNFCDKTISDSINQYDEVRKVSTEQGDDYTTGCFLDYKYFKDNYRLNAANLSNSLRAIQQIIFTGKIKATAANTRVIISYIFEKSKETTLHFSKATTKVL